MFVDEQMETYLAHDTRVDVELNTDYFLPETDWRDVAMGLQIALNDNKEYLAVKHKAFNDYMSAEWARRAVNASDMLSLFEHYKGCVPEMSLSYAHEVKPGHTHNDPPSVICALDLAENGQMIGVSLLDDPIDTDALVDKLRALPKDAKLSYTLNGAKVKITGFVPSIMYNIISFYGVIQDE